MPRNLSGMELAALLPRRYGYNITCQRGSYLRLTSVYIWVIRIASQFRAITR